MDNEPLELPNTIPPELPDTRADAQRFAGCSIETEEIAMEVTTP